MVSTLAPIKWKPGFKTCISKCNLHVYVAGDVTALCAIAGFYLALAFVLLKANVRQSGLG